jgi:hypothetical protein
MTCSNPPGESGTIIRAAVLSKFRKAWRHRTFLVAVCVVGLVRINSVDYFSTMRRVVSVAGCALLNIFGTKWTNPTKIITLASAQTQAKTCV